MKDWKQFLEIERSQDYFKELERNLHSEMVRYTIYPPEELIYNALELTPLKDVKCVIIGQDPYFNPGEAHGLAFSVQGGGKIPPSLRNIYKELKSDLGIERATGDLTSWAEQGVLLINRVLTVRKGEPNSHKDIGWMRFTESIVKTVSNKDEPVVFLLWGAEAIKLKKIIDGRHYVLESPHPSPLSAYRGFFGCTHFTKCNIFLSSRGQEVIRWED